MLRVRHFRERMAEHGRVIASAVEAFEEVSASYALAGGHAVSLYTKPRVTVDADFLVAKRDLPRLRRALEKSGHRLRKVGDAIRAFGPGEDPGESEAALELLPAESHPVWKGALDSAVEATYAGTRLRVVRRSALVAMKFAAAVSTDRPREDRHVDLSDLIRLLRSGLSSGEEREAKDLAARAYRGAAADFEKLVDDLRHDRPVTL
ncbi:MAG: nucleotidyl transferase AbiEii/AbiGii toxin family protein [Planctomycetes bacterium]|nr:nucleotidyl transferase AbiEii/AbiGii toxin family protein [Planctomycetota bacterium]